MRTATIGLCLLTIAASYLPSAAHDHATGVVKERMDMMEVMGKRLKAITGQSDERESCGEEHCDDTRPVGQHRDNSLPEKSILVLTLFL